MLSDRDAATKLSTDYTDYTDASEPQRAEGPPRRASRGEFERPHDPDAFRIHPGSLFGRLAAVRRTRSGESVKSVKSVDD
jgi:hypothetical protein